VITTIDQMRKADLFRGLHVPGKPLILFNVWDAGSTKAVANAGAKAIATSSWSVADANGFADGENVPLTLAIANLRRIVAVTDLPVTVDFESGYGVTPEEVGGNLALAIEAGAVGCNLEDSFPASGTLREVDDQCSRIRHARQIADATRIAFFLNARTDVFFQTKPAGMKRKCFGKRSNGHAPMHRRERTGSLHQACRTSRRSAAWPKHRRCH